MAAKESLKDVWLKTYLTAISSTFASKKGWDGNILRGFATKCADLAVKNIKEMNNE